MVEVDENALRHAWITHAADNLTSATIPEWFKLAVVCYARAALAKPASSPAGLWGIRWEGPLNKWWGTDGWSDDLRLAHRFADKQHAEANIRVAELPLDVSVAQQLPAFSPAGGDVVEALKRIAEHPEKYDAGVQSYDVGFAFWNVQKIARNALAALAGRVGE